ncbi:MAG: response regulator transcription factor [Acidimicrobiales bacterium]
MAATATSASPAGTSISERTRPRYAPEAGLNPNGRPRRLLRFAEAQVAALVSEGLSNREVAARLFVSEKTVEFHLTRVFRKLGVKRRSQLARILASNAP